MTKTQRDSFFDQLVEYAEADSDLVMVCADMSAPALDTFRKTRPTQFINTGIAEQNTVLIAAGLTLMEKKVYTYAIATFITLRAIELIRVNNGIMNIPVTILGMGTGLSYALDGPTHHLIEDVSMMRAFPNITIYNVTDSCLAQKVAAHTYANGGFNYVRLDKDRFDDIYQPSDSLESGFKVIMPGKNGYILSTGVATHLAIEVATRLRDNGIDVGVIDVFRIPILGDALIRQLEGLQQIYTIEEHFLAGGFGSHVLEYCSDHDATISVKRFGLSHQNGYLPSYQYGGRDLTREKYGLSVSGIVSDIMLRKDKQK